jgi:hypothetical protein
VEKIPFIHSSPGVYYHHYPFFLSKLTKEGKVSKRGQAPRGKANTARTNFCLQKCEAHLRGKHDGNDGTNGTRSGLQTSVQVQTQALLDFSLVYRKNETQMKHPERRTYSACTEKHEPGQLPEHQNDRKPAAAVENVLHIHSRECAEEPIFP